MTLRSLVTGLLGRWEGSLDRALRNNVAERDHGDTARGEFINTLIIEGAPAVRDPDGRVTHGRLRE